MRGQSATRISSLVVSFFLLITPAAAFAGSQTFSTPGYHIFAVPASYGSLYVTVNGAGGGAGNYDSYGADGGSSSFNGIVIGHGGGGSRGTTGRGAPGTASGGNISNITGGGAAGGDNGYVSGGNGGQARSGFGPGTLPRTVTVVVGAGAPGDPFYGGPGQNGSVYIMWTDAAPPPPPPPPPGLSCQITFDQNPINTGDTATIRWSSAGSPDAFYLRSIGWVGASGSTRVGPTVTTDYSGTVYKCPAGTTLNATHDRCVGGSGGGTPPQTAECPAQLTVGESCPPGMHWDETTRSCVAGGGPGAPAITAAGLCVVNQAQTYTLRSVDSDATAALRYGLDWDRNGVVDQWVPASGYVLQGTARTVAHVWTTAGTHTFQALAEDSTGRRSSWTWFSVMCTDGENACTPATYCKADQSCRKDARCTETCSPCTWGCNAGSGLCNPPPEPQIITWRVAPKLVQKNATTGVFWNVLNVTSCTVSSTGGDSWTSGEGGISQGSKTSRPITARTTFSLDCTPYEGATWTPQAPKVVNIVPVFREQ